MVHVSKISRTKWDKKADEYIIFGYPENTKGYRLYNPVTKNITTSRDVVIMENRKNSDMIQVAVEEKEKIVPTDHSMIMKLGSWWTNQVMEK